MDYIGENMKRIADYIRSGEKVQENCSIGTEFEHILLYGDTLKSVTYNDGNGVEALLRGLEKQGWDLVEENQRIMGATRDGDMVSLEPGAQVEISVNHTLSLKEIQRRYLQFLEDIKKVLNGNGQRLIALGYHPVSVIDQVSFIPKRRYDYMSDYLGKKDIHGHHMMKGTASAQVVIDYTSEEDFIKKFRVANSLTVLWSYLFDNSPVFEGKVWENNLARTNIWNHVDGDRSGILPGALDGRFGYEEYAAYVWKKPVIISLLDGSYQYTGSRTMEEVYGDRLMEPEEILHALSMFFPDVRAKRYIELRMCDSVPYPLNLSLAALAKGIFYCQKNLDWYYEASLGCTDQDVRKQKEIMVQGSKVPKALLAEVEEMLSRAQEGLAQDEQAYLDPLREMFHAHGNMATMFKERMKRGDCDPFKEAFVT